ncbi:phage head closure protein [Hazenella sp. IB182357]|uniref:Phage head closure protein n=1 Tax=Polycladospora coralii TaxID=2771432 RepID=A0A926NBV5_9BACL|nr:phage head closure protein [Polycladospora coralii]MBD1373717.1 phage head closure protein [Polycladospora coralii]
MINQLRRRVTIQKSTKIKNSEGAFTTVWTDVATIWAGIKPLRGREYFQAAAVQAENTVRFHIRYRKGIEPAMRILYDSRIFDIQSVIDVNERHKEIELMCKEVDA